MPLGKWLLASITAPKIVADATTVLFAWMMIFGLIGLFRQILAGYHPWVRYLSDASYFLYLMHLPLLLWLSNLLLGANIATGLKITLMCLLCSAILLACYHGFVRFTLLGTWLNGARQRQRGAERLDLARHDLTQ